MIPKEKDKIFIYSVSLGAISNLIINYLLIPKYASIGACIGTIIAEFVVMLYQVIKVKNELPIIDYLKDISNLFIKSIFMFILVYSINYIEISNIYKLLLQVIIGVTIYGCLNYKYIFSLLKRSDINEKNRC